jgi:uncharacterized membrane protein
VSWLLFAFTAPVLWAVSTHIDKYVVERWFRQGNVAVLLVFTAAINLLLPVLIWLWRPAAVALPAPDIAVIAASGMLSMTAMFFYLQALQSAEASMIAPLFQTAPLFGYGLGYLVLHETLSRLQLAGGAVTVAGALLLSVEPAGRGVRLRGRLMLLMLGCAFALSLSSLVFKFFAVRTEFWGTLAWNSSGEALFGVALLVPGRNRRQLGVMLRANTAAVLTINAVNEVVNLGGSLAVRYALLLAPLSLVQAVSGTTSLFVFGFGVLLSLLAPRLGREDLSLHTLLQKGLAAALVVVGVVLLSF